jgi:hypothetical protein
MVEPLPDAKWKEKMAPSKSKAAAPIRVDQHIPVMRFQQAKDKLNIKIACFLGTRVTYCDIQRELSIGPGRIATVSVT